MGSKGEAVRPQSRAFFAMALFRFLLASAIPLSRAVPGTDSFKVVSPALEAEAVLENEKWWHLGGFCFGMDQGAPVARLVVRMLWRGERPLDEAAKVYLVAFDGRQQHWGAAQQEWDTAGCERKLQVATDWAELHEMTFTKSLPSNIEKAFAINIHQKTATRDWHYALMACGNVESAPLKLTMEAVSGALSVFAAGDNFDQSSCPVMPISWWAEGQGEASFWLLLVATAIISACFGCGFLMLSKWLRHAKHASVKSSSDVNENDEVVIGKPCQAPDGDIADGQINVQNGKMNQKVNEDV